MSDTLHDVIIVGSGPAGYTAAIYSARAELTPLVFEGSQFGGALMTTTEVENFPGFAEGMMGPDLMMQMREQAERFGADLRMEDVTSIDLVGDVKTVRVGEEEHRARAVILGQRFVAKEAELEARFGKGDLLVEELDRIVRETEMTRAELRVAHLAADIEVSRILTKAQVARYGRLRGYR